VIAVLGVAGAFEVPPEIHGDMAGPFPERFR
jgi:hypothetical protein